MDELAAEKKQRKQNAIDKLKEKKRLQKMKRKAKDEKSESGKSSAVLSTKSPTGEDEDSVSPQKRKGTIWKILFPDKKSEDDA